MILKIEALEELVARLDRMDRTEAWTRPCLRTIRQHPEVPSRLLATLLGTDTKKLKPRIRRLKALALTESLERGYRLSPRGHAVLDPAPELEIRTLEAVRETVPILAHHFAETWAPYYGKDGPGDAHHDLIAAAQTGRLPLGIAAFHRGALAGAAALRARSLPSHDHLTPWVTGLVVLPAYRGFGIADALLRDLENRAGQLGFTELHIATDLDSDRMRQRGWRTMDRASTLRGDVPVLRLRPPESPRDTCGSGRNAPT